MQAMPVVLVHDSFHPWIVFVLKFSQQWKSVMECCPKSLIKVWETAFSGSFWSCNDLLCSILWCLSHNRWCHMCELALAGTQEMGELSICTCRMGRQLYFEVMYADSCPNSLSQNSCSNAVTCAEYYVPKQSPILYDKMLSANCITVFSVLWNILTFFLEFLQNILALL